jgi:hypothetical protein
MPWGDRDRVGVRLAWASALCTTLVVLSVLVAELF